MADDNWNDQHWLSSLGGLGMSFNLERVPYIFGYK